MRAAPIKRIRPPPGRFRLVCFNIMQNKIFEHFIFICIVLNTIVLTLKWYEQDESIVRALEVINYVFSAIFLIEAILKILGLGPKRYFSDGWNQFDFIIAVGSVISIIISSFL